MCTANRLLKYALLVIGILQGLFMLTDGIHVIMTGSYISGQVGPWAVIVRAVGVNVYGMGPVFLVLGSLWLFGSILLLVRPGKGLMLLAITATVTLFYAVFGTLLSIIALAIIVLNRRTLREKRAEPCSASPNQAP